MTSSKTKMTYYKGTWWHTTMLEDGTRAVRPLQMRGGQLVAFGATRYYHKPGQARG